MIGQATIFTAALVAAATTALGCAPATSAERCWAQGRATSAAVHAVQLAARGRDCMLSASKQP